MNIEIQKKSEFIRLSLIAYFGMIGLKILSGVINRLEGKAND